MNMIKALAVVMLFFLTLGGIGSYILYSKSPQEKAEISVNAQTLWREFQTNEMQANTKYFDKVIEVTGTISEVMTDDEGKTIVRLSTGHPSYSIQCTMQESLSTPVRGEQVTIQGLCAGYLSNVMITHAHVN